MARSRKTGLDYFPLDCQMDDKMDMLEAEHGLVGFAVYIKLLQLIYQTEEGELDMSNIFRWKTLGKKWELNEETLRKLVGTMCEIGMFDKNSLEERQILTSTGVQKRLGKVAGLRQKDRLRHGKADSNGAESFSHGKPAENAGKSTQRESKEKVNITADAVVGARATTGSASQSENQKAPELLADEAPVFKMAEFSAFVNKMGYDRIDKGRYLIEIQRKADDEPPRTNKGWENYILTWLKNDQQAGRLLPAENSARSNFNSSHAADVTKTSYFLSERSAQQSQPAY